MQEKPEVSAEGKISKEGWIDETGRYDESIIAFIRDGINKINTRERYDSMTEFHFSGLDEGFQNARQGSGELSFARILYENGEPIQIHVKFKDSTMDIYISGRAIEDWRQTIAGKGGE